jgi:hypothetical protein
VKRKTSKQRTSKQKVSKRKVSKRFGRKAFYSTLFCKVRYIGSVRNEDAEERVHTPRSHRQCLGVEKVRMLPDLGIPSNAVDCNRSTRRRCSWLEKIYCYGGYHQRPCHFSRLQVRLRGAGEL